MDIVCIITYSEAKILRTYTSKSIPLTFHCVFLLNVIISKSTLKNGGPHLKMFNGEDFITAKGVTLSRELSSENKLWVRLFLQGEGVVSLSSKNFKGDSEPFIWAVYSIRKNSLNSKYFVYEIDVKDDMLTLRQSRETLSTVLNWTKLIIKYTPHEQPDDDLLSILYWNMKLLASPSVPYHAADWRFLWQWLEHWGLAPDIVNFFSSNKFTNKEITLLIQVLNLNVKGVIELFNSQLNASIRENIFKVAARLSSNFLRQI